MVDDDATQEALEGAPPPTTEIDSETAAAGPLAYSEHTSSMPVIDYRPAPRRRWIGVLVLVAAAGVAAAMFVLGRTTARQEPAAAVPPAPTSVPAVDAPSASAVPPPAAPPPVAAVPPPPVTVTATPAPAPVPAAMPEALPPDAQFIQMLARDGVSNSHPSGAIATAKNVCASIENGASADDFVLSMNAAGMPYPEAVAFVRDARTVYCPNAG